MGKSRKSHCIEDLKRRILTESLAPGAYLDETILSEEYEISRPPLREILSQLAGEGYVVLNERRGTQVAPMTHRTMRNFFMAAPMIYAAVSRLAALHATRAQIMQLKDTQLLFRAAIRDGDTAERAIKNERFHAIIGDMAANEYLTPSLRRLLIDHTRIGMTFYESNNPRTAEQRRVAADQHDQFIELIEAGDADGAAGLAIEHWELSRSEMESFVTPPGMDIPLGPVRDETGKKGT
ncbi:GntR family transcriptional regulator [Paracoccus onubensis]|uniref:GntR family transcriptional regulator n=1 Tax=Paracoccus onubensis TaxID=1675788 RepID=UPI002731D391|nr:GntR family transcriptional regulator [Paracoccus onubensis]MDP0926994.1 GntR family transcriptional regulator [Paracoccus onubensis]